LIAIDTSAVVALVSNEPARHRLAQTLAAHKERIMSPISFVELVMVLSRRFADPKAAADRFIDGLRINLVPVNAAQTDWAAYAFATYGKGRSPARLNLGDCFSYAVAKAHDAPLLFVGNDFSLTDVRRG
jgi:ribonuclease VapC